MKESKKAIHEELMQKIFHPKNIMKFNDWGFDTDVHPLPLRKSREPDPLRSSVPLEMYEE
jgi:hypothetical protein